MGFNVDTYFDKKNKGQVLASYKGCISVDLITQVLVSVEEKLNKTLQKSLLKKKLYNILVESLQNLYHHIEDPEEYCKEGEEDHFGMFVIAKINGTYKITTGNFMKKKKIPSLKKHLDKINRLSNQSLKQWYKDVLNNQMFSHKGGGGLGLIDIARRSGDKLEYNFFNYNKNFSFFSLDINIL